MQHIKSREEFRSIMSRRKEKHYVYVLRKPDDKFSFGAIGTPFYVGLGQGERMYSHEKEAENNVAGNDRKLAEISNIVHSGKEVIYTIDSWHHKEPWTREADLIADIGCLYDRTGPLTNANSYRKSKVIDGIETRKYAPIYGGGREPGNYIRDFRLKRTNLMVGPRTPKTRKSVFGKMYTVLETNPGITGEEFVIQLMEVDFSGNKSAYTQSGRVSTEWLIGYIEGGYFRKGCLYFQEHKRDGDGHMP